MFNISQIGDTGKEHQIQLMKDIYSGAKVTYIWLGEASDNGNLAIDFISNIRASISKNYIPEVPAWKALELLFWRYI